MKILETFKIIHQNRHDSSKTNWIQRERKTQNTRAHRIWKQIFQAICLFRHSSNRNREQAIEDILVDWHIIFAGHRIDVRVIREIKFKPIPKGNKAVYSQSLPVLIHLKEDLIVELSPIHKYGFTTILLFSKYASPLFAKRKPNGKLRFLVDLRKINSLVADDYTNNYNTVSILSDAAKHLVGKFLFCKIDCSPAYDCLQKADQRSAKMLAFNFASRTFAYKRIT